MTKLKYGIAIVLALSVFRGDARAQPPSKDLVLQPLEDLMRIEVTSAGRREQPFSDVPAAVHVITQEDIRRSGLRSLPELFRLVPGMEVAAVNANKWAVSIRGFNDLFANKVLVLIDGRSIYKRTFSGVFWHAEDLMLEDIDRIEIVRGPGGATWGANAVNGVINIITKPATDTHGGVLRSGTGSADPGSAALRYGGRFKSVDYRVFGLYSDHAGGLTLGRAAAPDDWNSFKGGFRTDWSSRQHSVMVQGSMLDGTQRALWFVTSPTPGAPTVTDGGLSSADSVDVLGRWTYALRSRSSLQVQSFFSRQHLRDVSQAEVERIADVDVEYRTRVGRHDIVSGGGYRALHHSDNGGSYTFSLLNARPHDAIINAFVQDEMSFGRRVRTTLGTKVEHDTTAGASFQPTVRAIWNVVPDRQHLWAALSSAVRTPALTDLNMRVNFASFLGPQGVPVMLGLLGNPALQSEKFLSSEAGYRVSVASRIAADVAAFRGRYTGLPTLEPVPPVFEPTPAPAHVFIASRFENLLAADTAGVETSVDAMPRSGWRLTGSHTFFHVSPHPGAGSRDAVAATFDANAPAHQWQLRSSWSLRGRSQLDAAVFHIGRLRELEIPAYTRVDGRIQIALGSGVSLVGTGQNVFDRAHAEFSSPSVEQTLMRRNVHLQVVWRF